MVDSACRSLRDGVLEGEFAPALMLHYHSLQASHAANSLFLHFARYIGSKVAAGAAQAKHLVFVAIDRHPEAYLSLLDFKEHIPPWLHFVDCYSDPLAWKKDMGHSEVLGPVSASSNLYCKMRDLSSLSSLIVEVGKPRSDDTPDNTHVSVLIDSVSSLLRHNSINDVARFLNSLRSKAEISSVIWLLHSELHDERTIGSLEYISSIIVSVGRSEKPVLWRRDENISDDSDLYTLKVRQKRRNGRVREQIENFKLDGSNVKIQSQAPVVEAVKTNVPQIISQVQFKLQLSDKERSDRAKVVLPFEHQGNGRESYIYNGRPDTRSSITEDSISKNNELGEVNYIRDSDDERPDSDEDPDDDLDI